MVGVCAFSYLEELNSRPAPLAIRDGAVRSGKQRGPGHCCYGVALASVTPTLGCSNDATGTERQPSRVNLTILRCLVYVWSAAFKAVRIWLSY